MERKRAVVLLVEDSPADQVIVQRAFEDGRVDCTLLLADNGAIALDMLQSNPPYTDKKKYPCPDLLLLDINMPVMDGRQTLRRIRENPVLCHLPVIMLTTSARDKDVIDSYRLGVNAYLTKPVDEKAFAKAVIQLENFWFELITLPPDAIAYKNDQSNKSA